jgi:hypothetical protein
MRGPVLIHGYGFTVASGAAAGFARPIKDCAWEFESARDNDRHMSLGSAAPSPEASCVVGSGRGRTCGAEPRKGAVMRVVMAGVLAAVVYFLWGFVSWTVLPWHDWTIRPMPAEDQVALSDMLSKRVAVSGVFYFPTMPRDPGDVKAVEHWRDMHRSGPVGTLMFHREGWEPMSARKFLISGGFNLVVGLLLAWLVWLTRHVTHDYWQRAGVCVIVGVIMAVATDLMWWNWLFHPIDYAVVNAIDHVVACTLMGLTIGAVIPSMKPRMVTVKNGEGDAPATVKPAWDA